MVKLWKTKRKVWYQKNSDSMMGLLGGGGIMSMVGRSEYSRQINESQKNWEQSQRKAQEEYDRQIKAQQEAQKKAELQVKTAKKRATNTNLSYSGLSKSHPGQYLLKGKWVNNK